MRRNILTPGSKKRLLTQLMELVDCVEADQDREVILWKSAAIMPAVVSELNFYPEPQKPVKGRKTRAKRYDVQSGGRVYVDDPNRNGKMPTHDF